MQVAALLFPTWRLGTGGRGGPGLRRNEDKIVADGRCPGRGLPSALRSMDGVEDVCLSRRLK